MSHVGLLGPSCFNGCHHCLIVAIASSSEATPLFSLQCSCQHNRQQLLAAIGAFSNSGTSCQLTCCSTLPHIPKNMTHHSTCSHPGAPQLLEYSIETPFQSFKNTLHHSMSPWNSSFSWIKWCCFFVQAKRSNISRKILIPGQTTLQAWYR